MQQVVSVLTACLLWSLFAAPLRPGDGLGQQHTQPYYGVSYQVTCCDCPVVAAAMHDLHLAWHDT